MDFESVNLPNHKIKPIIIGSKKVTPPKKQSSMNRKQFQEFVIKFIKKQDETNKIVVQRLDKQEEFNKKQEKFNEMILQKVDNIDQRLIKVENDIKDIKSCPTIQKELNSK